MNFDPNKKLEKREYLGEGFFHYFKENKTGDVVSVECTRAEYEALGEPGSAQPFMKGCTWDHSAGGTVKVDSADGFLGEGEYTVKGNEVFAVLGGSEMPLARSAVDGAHTLDISKVPQK